MPNKLPKLRKIDKSKKKHHYHINYTEKTYFSDRKVSVKKKIKRKKC